MSLFIVIDILTIEHSNCLWRVLPNIWLYSIIRHYRVIYSSIGNRQRTRVLVFLTLYYNSQCGQLPDGFKAQFSRALHRYKQRSWVQIQFRPELFSGFHFTTAWVVCIAAMINHVVISFSAVHMIFHIFIYVFSKYKIIFSYHITQGSSLPPSCA